MEVETEMEKDKVVIRVCCHHSKQAMITLQEMAGLIAFMAHLWPS